MRHEPPVRVPCAVCLTMIESWSDSHAQPCQHSLTDIWMIWKEVSRVVMVDYSFTATCPHCGRVHDGHAGDDSGGPKPGDVSFCWKCKKPGVYSSEGDTLVIRKPTKSEFEEIVRLPLWRQVVAAAHESYRPLEAAKLVHGD